MNQPMTTRPAPYGYEPVTGPQADILPLLAGHLSGLIDSIDGLRSVGAFIPMQGDDRPLELLVHDTLVPDVCLRLRVDLVRTIDPF